MKVGLLLLLALSAPAVANVATRPAGSGDALTAAVPEATPTANDGCIPDGTASGTTLTVSFRSCPPAPLYQKASVELEYGGRTYSGYVARFSNGEAEIRFDTPLPVTRAIRATLRVGNPGTPAEWRIRLTMALQEPRAAQESAAEQAPAPRRLPQPQQSSVAPREQQQPNANPVTQRAAEAAAPPPALPAKTLATNHDVLALSGSGGQLRAGFSSGTSARLGGDGRWSVAPANRQFSETDLPLRYWTPFSAVTAAGKITPVERWTPLDRSVNALSGDGTWAVGNNGELFRFANGGWQSVASGVTDRALYGVAFKESNGVIVGERGLVLTSYDSGTTWTRVAVPTTIDLRGVSPATDKTWYAAGTDGVVLRSENNGATWVHLTRETRTTPEGFPITAPWYLLVNLLVTLPALAIATVVRRGDAEHVEHLEAIAETLVSDRALQAGEPDALNLRAIALGISRFLRNEKTVPPLTIAVTGEWGSGKSSLMNLLKADLAEWGFRPVWFNAWHHQKEQHFLASLVQAIRREAAPPWWHLPFRSRLLWLRTRQHPMVAAGVLLAIAVVFGYERSHQDGGIFAPAMTALRAGTLWDFFLALPDALKDEFAFLVSIVSTAGALWKGAHAFAAKPAVLLATVTAQAKLGDLAEEISFRSRFAPEFRDVTKALGDRPLVLFIDDLDRCQPDSVREMLEAINFLVSSGECYIVLGIDRTRVERYLNLSFGEAAKQEQNFAANYLDKLINIEVPVPSPDDKEALSILSSGSDIPEARSHASLDRLRALTAAAWRLKPAFAGAAIVLIGLLLGSTMRQPLPVETVAADAALRLPTTAPSKPAIGQSIVDLPTPEEEKFSTGSPGNAVSGKPRLAVVRDWPVLLFLAAIGAISAWIFLLPPGLVVRDSAAFAKAVTAWQPLLLAKSRTPRSLKRFLNRVRYLAMRQRVQQEELTFGRKVRAVLLGQRIPPPLVPSSEPIPEPALVALAAMYHHARDWVANDDALHGRLDVAALKESRARHREAFNTDPDIARWAEQFRRICSDVRVN